MMMIDRNLSYRQCVVLAAVARRGGEISDDALRELIGPYATNVIKSLIEHQVLEERQGSQWGLSIEGCDVARELLGAQVVKP
jgi:hypothetical protein